MAETNQDDLIDHILGTAETIAVVGMSDNIQHESFRVGMYLKTHGYTIIPVNPNTKSIKGMQSYPSITDIPSDITIDVVDIFRRSDEVMPHVKEAVKRGVKTIWMQRGVVNKEAADYARTHGAVVIMDKCMMAEHIRRY
jgi:predicted CoA-binding protein